MDCRNFFSQQPCRFGTWTPLGVLFKRLIDYMGDKYGRNGRRVRLAIQPSKYMIRIYIITMGVELFLKGARKRTGLCYYPSFFLTCSPPLFLGIHLGGGGEKEVECQRN